MDDTQKPARLFAALSSIMIAAAVAAVGTHIFEQAQKGVFPWWPYLAFTVFIGFIFAGYGLLSRTKN